MKKSNLLQHLLGTQAKPLQDARSEALQNNICSAAQLDESIATLCFLEIQDDGFLSQAKASQKLKGR